MMDKLELPIKSIEITRVLKHDTFTEIDLKITVDNTVKIQNEDYMMSWM